MPTLLSIDIGIKNLGWALLTFEEDDTIVDCKFGIFIIDDNDIHANTARRKESTVIRRCNRIIDFFEIFGVLPDMIVLERQVNNNTMAMELMYAITMYASINEISLFVFDPKLKFTFYHEEYTTKNKAHKRASVVRATEYIKTKFPDKVELFESNEKKDDISDAINQGITYLEMSKLIERK